MPKRFYAAWAFVVILAAVVPIAVPYAIWPPNAYEGGTIDGTVQPNLYGRPGLVAGLVPGSVSVNYGPRSDIKDGKCISGPASNDQRDTTANVILRGAYGISFGSVEVTCTSESGLRTFLGIGLLVAPLAWLLGMAVVSVPFVLVLERRLAERRGSRSFLNRFLPG